MLRPKQRLKSNYNNNQTLNTLHINSFPCESTTFFLLLWRRAPTRVMASSFTRSVDHKQRRNAVGRNPSPRRTEHYLTHKTHNRQIYMPPGVFEPTIPAREWPHGSADTAI